MTTTTYDQLFSFFGLHQNPFGVSPDMRFFFSTPAHESTMAELLFAIQTRQGLMLLTGEAGAGKTTLLQQLLDNLHGRRVSTSYIFHSRLDADDLFRFILQDFGVACSSRHKGDVIQTLHDWLVRRHSVDDTPVIIIDEAHVLPAETIDELRLLLNLESADGKLVQILLAGQPELDEKLRQPELRQLRQRVMFRCKLPLLSREETSGYIRSRLSSAGVEDLELFPPAATDAIFQYSKGIPRTINLLGEHAIINAYAEHQHTVAPDSIRYIAADFDLVENPLSVSPDADSSGAPRVSRFPLLDPEPQSLSDLRMAYLSELPLQDTYSLAPAPRVGFEPDKSLGTAESGDFSLESAVPAPTPGESVQPTAARTALTDPLPAGILVEHDIPSPAIAQVPPAAATSGNGHSIDRNQRNNSLKRYWKDVAGSFRRDARACYANWAAILHGARGKANGNGMKPQSEHS